MTRLCPRTCGCLCADSMRRSPSPLCVAPSVSECSVSPAPAVLRLLHDPLPRMPLNLTWKERTKRLRRAAARYSTGIIARAQTNVAPNPCSGLFSNLGKEKRSTHCVVTTSLASIVRWLTRHVRTTPFVPGRHHAKGAFLALGKLSSMTHELFVYPRVSINILSIAQLI